ncbi:GTP cyclohydrolase II [Rhodovulum sulfidophilum]|uniref:GTP cyclohydrolase-2 n=1 Tax=Rhodovulum visakhapatnamense TaxID=364297 RepID=A0ABS1RBE8_9RHOB|nr:GTP cyclohydrolase II [Rhodovulum visakhapatnamense]MBL3570644.1 GTP cyclohydrolase II [Rhodovulum visakhapatnamense]MBL3576962.1 GTP cyclohydrolase II [Rhodovulum visakhapatnamense]OLS42968.1 GTP cyclohydrolase II [Rhodovulum sulfidophilum]
MRLGPGSTERLARARGDLRMGVPVVVGPLVVVAAETLTPGRLDALRALGGRPVLAITARRAETLKARPYDGDLARLLLPTEVGTDWVRAVADPADDLSKPMLGPFASARGGDAEAHRAAIALAKSARLLPAVLAVEVTAPDTLAGAEGLTRVTLDEAALARAEGTALAEVVSARVPLEVSKAGRLHVFRPADGSEEHYAVEIGTPPRGEPVLARLHSACFTGDLLGSLKCDCGAQLRTALAQMGKEGAGVLLYLNQEGRGIGLANKMRAYSLQDQGFDTVEANHRLGFEDDERDFRIGAAILREMGFSAVRLMTNNPAKIEMMRARGIAVTERVPLKVGHTPENARYLAVKAEKSGHLM